MSNVTVTLGDISFVTKLAGFEHTKYIQHNATHEINDVPLVIGKNVKNGKVKYEFDWYIPNDISDALPRSVLDKECIVIPYVGSKLGELAVFRNDFKCHLGSNVAKVELTGDILDIHYLYYYLKSSYGQLQLFKGKQGSAQPNITMTAIRETVIVKYEKEYQKKIAKVLSDLDAKIELNNKINAELEAMAKLIYDYWFVQFDFPDPSTSSGKAGKPYKSSGGKMVYNKELKREIPHGWKVGTLLDIAKFTNGLACQKNRPKKGEGFYRVIKIKEMSDGFTDNSEFVSQNIPEKIIVRNGDILFSWSATLDVQIWTSGIGGLNQHIFKVTSEKYPRSYFYYELLNYLQHFKMMAQLRKTTMGHITQDHLKQSRICIPPINLINNLEAILNPILEKIILNKTENQKLVELRDWLLPMLMNGQVKVGGIEKSVQLNMAAEPEVSYGKKSIEKEEQAFLKRKVLASYIINHSLNDNYFGNVKFEKLLHLADYHAVQRNLGQKYLQQAAGPYDNAFTYAFFTQVEKAKWFKRQNVGNLKKIVAAENHDKSTNTYNYFSDKELKKVNDLISKFKNCNYEQPEIVSTLYAVWNNRIIKQEPITDELLKQDFLKWDQQKAKYKNRLDDALQWMRKENLVPNGWGSIIEKSKKK